MINRIAGRLQRWRWTNLWRTSPLAVGRRRRYIRTLAPHRLLGRARSRSRDTAIAAAYPGRGQADEEFGHRKTTMVEPYPLSFRPPTYHAAEERAFQ